MKSSSNEEPLQGITLFVAVFAINIVVFAELLDLSILNVMIPAVAGDLGASPLEGTWAISSYALAAALVQPLTGWLTKRVGEVHLFVWSTALFTIASLCCAMAPNLQMLIFARLFQGAVSGPLMPLSQSLMLKSFPTHQRGLAQALWGVTALVAPVFGPVIGGWIIDNYSWRLAFMVNLPVGILVVAILSKLMLQKDVEREKMPIDYIGAFFLFAGIGAIQWLLDNGNHQNWFDSNEIRLFAVMGFVGLLLFIIWERNEQYPIVDFSILKLPNFSMATVLVAMAYGNIWGITLLHTLWLQISVGYPATTAGLSSAIFGVAAIPGFIAMGLWGTRLPKREMVTLGLLISAMGSVWLALMPDSANFWQLSLPRTLHGISVPIMMLPLLDITLGSVSDRQMANGTAISGFARTITLSFIVAVVVTIWDRRTIFHHNVLSESFSPVKAHGLTQFASITPKQSPSENTIALLDSLAHIQSQTLAFNDICWLSAVVFICMIPLAWTCKPPFGEGAGGVH